MALFGRSKCSRGKCDEWDAISKFCLTAYVCKRCGRPKDAVLDPIRLQAQAQVAAEGCGDEGKVFGPACMRAMEVYRDLLSQLPQYNKRLTRV